MDTENIRLRWEQEEPGKSPHAPDPEREAVKPGPGSQHAAVTPVLARHLCGKLHLQEDGQRQPHGKQDAAPDRNGCGRDQSDHDSNADVEETRDPVPLHEHAESVDLNLHVFH